MTPITFGSSLFGWLHLPSGAARRAGVVLCTSHGDEYLCAFRALRVLAEQLAEHGFPVLRFDYHGTGDSAGSDRDPGRVAAWRKSIHEAVDELRTRTEVSAVYLVGLRLGALLAPLCAAERDDVRGLVLWSPFRIGRGFIRELKALNAASAGSDWVEKDLPAARGPGDAEAGGFFLGAETLSNLAQIDLATLDRSPERVFLIGRDTIPVDEKLRARFVELGAEVETRQIMGFAGMMTARHNAELPSEVIAAVTHWLVAHEPATAPLAGTPPAPPRLVTTETVETPIQFGPERRLFGILAEPRTAFHGRPAILLLTIGANHHVGANGMYVRLARAWTRLGFTSLRFDLSGIGDSAPHPGAKELDPYPRKAVDDVRAALQLLRGRGFREFVLVGLCSGGYHAFKTALVDSSIVGLIVMNPQTFAYQEGEPLDVTRKRWTDLRSASHYRQSAFQLDKWLKLLRGQVDLGHITRLFVDRAHEVATGRLRKILGLRSPDAAAESFGAEFRRLCDRGTDFTMIYSTDDPGLDYLTHHAARYVEKLKNHPKFCFIEIQGPDHTFTPLWSQVELLEHLNRRLVRFLPPYSSVRGG